MWGGMWRVLALAFSAADYCEVLALVIAADARKVGAKALKTARAETSIEKRLLSVFSTRYLTKYLNQAGQASVCTHRSLNQRHTSLAFAT